MDDKRIAMEIRTAIKEGDVNRVSELIGSDKARLEMMTLFGTWLHVAAAHNKLTIVKRLVDMGADVNRNGGILGGAPLNQAASEGHTDIVDFLLSRGATMDVSEPERNPLFSAIRGGHTAVAKLLIERGIDVRVKYKGKVMKDTDALAFARQWGRLDIAALLAEGGNPPLETPRSHEPNDPSRKVIDFFGELLGPVQPLALVEVLSTEPPIAVHMIAAAPERNYITLFTTGMSARPMMVPPGEDDYRFAELFIQLPANWPLTEKELANPANGWPIHWLRSIAKYPHQHNTWLGHPVTILTNGDPPEPLSPSIQCTCIMLMEQYKISINGLMNMNLYQIIPIYNEERHLEVVSGLPALMDALDRNHISLIIDTKRRNAAIEL